MKTPEDADALARACVDLAAGWGRPARAAVTDMSQPLGQAVGNALDIEEAVGLLRGERGGRLRDLTIEFVAAAQSALLDTPEEDARGRAERALSSGEAAEGFRRMVEAQGGDPRVVDDPHGVLPRAPVARPLPAERSGHLAAVDAEAIGRAAAALGAGRIKKGEPIDPAVGIVFHPKVGDRLESGQPIGEIRARSEDAAAAASVAVNAALTISEEPVVPPPLVYRWRDV
jgi:pyrimidine-nucleoside phosphorylase